MQQLSYIALTKNKKDVINRCIATLTFVFFLASSPCFSQNTLSDSLTQDRSRNFQIRFSPMELVHRQWPMTTNTVTFDNTRLPIDEQFGRDRLSVWGLSAGLGAIFYENLEIHAQATRGFSDSHPFLDFQTRFAYRFTLPQAYGWEFAPGVFYAIERTDAKLNIASSNSARVNYFVRSVQSRLGPMAEASYRFPITQKSDFAINFRYQLGLPLSNISAQRVVAYAENEQIPRQLTENIPANDPNLRFSSPESVFQNAWHQFSVGISFFFMDFKRTIYEDLDDDYEWQ
ncbi:MAG: hypothetical protein LAT68_00365 [Cyclobacteriaceae bacterium]|nr:hypothetical protein [Cyclobacteriaceae bacterium]MCH8514755.1 hypothetical protein [Cyclobacteriaceae bacterium]